MYTGYISRVLEDLRYKRIKTKSSNEKLRFSKLELDLKDIFGDETLIVIVKKDSTTVYKSPD